MRTLLGTSDRPFIDLQPHVDVEGLRKLKISILRGIAMATAVYPTSYYHDYLWDESYKSGYYALQRAEEETDPEVREALTFLAEQPAESHEQRRRRNLMFSNLLYEGYSGGTSIPLREGTKFGDRSDPTKNWWTPNAQHFRPLLQWVKTLPLTSVGRINIFFNTPFAATPIHRDGPVGTHKNEFVWLGISGKRFFLWDEETETKLLMDSPALFFDERSFHGTEPSRYFQWSMRIDGTFTPELREKVGIARLTNYCAKAEPTT